MKRCQILLVLLLGGCGSSLNESKLVGGWEADLPAPKRITYVFHNDHTYEMRVAGQAGSIQGNWKLEGATLEISLKSFGAYGMTNDLPALNALNSQKQKVRIAKLDDSIMVWRSGIEVTGGGLKLKRVKRPGSSTAAPSP